MLPRSAAGGMRESMKAFILVVQIWRMLPLMFAYFFRLVSLVSVFCALRHSRPCLRISATVLLACWMASSAASDDWRHQFPRDLGACESIPANAYQTGLLFNPAGRRSSASMPFRKTPAGKLSPSGSPKMTPAPNPFVSKISTG